MRSLIVIAAFLFIGLFPAIQKVTGVLPDAPLDENRLMEPAPEWSEAADLAAYFLGWQRWFNDRYPGRNLLIRLKTQLDFSLFSYSEEVHIGRDGWLFYRNVLDVQKPAFEALTDAQIDDLIVQIRTLCDWLRERGITPLFFDNQLKDEFYSDMLPLSAPMRPENPRYRQFRERLRAEIGATYVDTYPILAELAQQRPIFHRTDFHWNDPAAFEVARRIVDTLAREAGPPVRGWKFELSIERRWFSGGQASFMPLLWPAREEGLFVAQTWTDRPATHGFNEGPFEYVFRAEDPEPEDLPPTVVFGDSFFDGVSRSGFFQHFVSLHRARIHAATLTDVLKAIPEGTRFMLLQATETAIGIYSVPIDYLSLQ